MKSTGIVRNIDGLGRIVIPAETKKLLGLKNGDPLEIFMHKEMIVLKPYFQADEMMDLTHRMNSRLCDIKNDELRTEIFEKIGELQMLIEEDKS